jgi:cytochrome c oxidase subunit IV
MAQSAKHIEKTEHGSHHDGHDDGHVHVPPSTYYKVFVALMVLLVLTDLASRVELGFWNVPVALAIAITKAVLIILYFMHVKYNTVMVKIFSVTAFVFVAIMFALTFADYMTRTWLPNPGH